MQRVMGEVAQGEAAQVPVPHSCCKPTPPPHTPSLPLPHTKLFSPRAVAGIASEGSNCLPDLATRCAITSPRCPTTEPGQSGSATA